jgi:hypothetical protein
MAMYFMINSAITKAHDVATKLKNLSESELRQYNHFYIETVASEKEDNRKFIVYARKLGLTVIEYDNCVLKVSNLIGCSKTVKAMGKLNKQEVLLLLSTLRDAELRYRLHDAKLAQHAATIQHLRHKALQAKSVNLITCCDLFLSFDKNQVDCYLSTLIAHEQLMTTEFLITMRRDGSFVTYKEGLAIALTNHNHAISLDENIANIMMMIGYNEHSVVSTDLAQMRFIVNGISHD